MQYGDLKISIFCFFFEQNSIIGLIDTNILILNVQYRAKCLYQELGYIIISCILKNHIVFRQFLISERTVNKGKAFR